MMPDRIEKLWRSFKVAAFPFELSKQQNIDLKRTFFAGAVAMIAAIGEVPLEVMSAEDTLTELKAELMMFNEEVRAGRA